MTVLAALPAGLARLLPVLGKVSALLAAFAIAIHGLAAAVAVLTTFLPGFGSALAILGEVAAAAAMFGCHWILLWLVAVPKQTAASLSGSPKDQIITHIIT